MILAHSAAVVGPLRHEVTGPHVASVVSSVRPRVFENVIPPRLEPRLAPSGFARGRAGSPPAASTARSNRANLYGATCYARCLVSFLDEVCRFVCRLGRSRRWKWTPKETGKRTSQRRPVKRSKTTSTTRGFGPPDSIKVARARVLEGEVWCYTFEDPGDPGREGGNVATVGSRDVSGYSRSGPFIPGPIRALAPKLGPLGLQVFELIRVLGEGSDGGEVRRCRTVQAPMWSEVIVLLLPAPERALGVVQIDMPVLR